MVTWHDYTLKRVGKYKYVYHKTIKYKNVILICKIVNICVPKILEF